MVTVLHGKVATDSDSNIVFAQENFPLTSNLLELYVLDLDSKAAQTSFNNNNYDLTV
jgi:hypothetical protein